MAKGHIRGIGTRYASGLESSEIWIQKPNAADLPYVLGARVPVTLVIDDRVYQAGLRATENNTYVWICPDLRDHQGKRISLAEVAENHGLAKNQRVRLVADGRALTLHRLGDGHRSFIDQIKETMRRQNIDFERMIDELGQVAAAERRKRGETFTLREHIGALIMAQLSNNRPWGPIAENRGRLDEIFFHYDPAKLKLADSETLASSVKKIQCGNRAIGKQMLALRDNIVILEGIDDLDTYVASASPDVIARSFSKGKFKLTQIGFPLAMEYLRNVGIEAVKPDQHICRMVGPERLGLTDISPSPEQAEQVLKTVASEANVGPTYLDNILWIFAAKDYAAICTADPRCEICLVRTCHKNELD